MLVYGDSDMYRPEHIVKYHLLGGGLEGCGLATRAPSSPNRLAILPGLTHYDIFLFAHADGDRPAFPERGEHQETGPHKWRRRTDGRSGHSETKPLVDRPVLRRYIPTHEHAHAILRAFLLAFSVVVDAQPQARPFAASPRSIVKLHCPAGAAIKRPSESCCMAITAGHGGRLLMPKLATRSAVIAPDLRGRRVRQAGERLRRTSRRRTFTVR